MIKVYKLKTIMAIATLIIIILMLTFIIYNNFNKEEIETTSNNDQNVYKILVDVEESKLYLFENEVLIKTYSCSGGKRSTPSPIGTWTVIQKAKWGEGFRTEVGFGLNVPWGKFGIHGTLDTYSVGWSSSHGCIRMNNSEVAELYKMVPIGTKVTIIDGVYGDFGKGFRTLKSGMYGSDVLQIQKRLKELGFFTGVVNGKFGSETEKAVQRFCKANNMYVTKIITPEMMQKMSFILFD